MCEKKKQSRNIRQYKFISPDFSGQKVDAISNQFVSFLWTQLFAGTACMFKSHNKVCFFFFLSSANALVSLSNTSMFRPVRVSWLFALPFFYLHTLKFFHISQRSWLTSMMFAHKGKRVRVGFASQSVIWRLIRASLPWCLCFDSFAN